VLAKPGICGIHNIGLEPYGDSRWVYTCESCDEITAYRERDAGDHVMGFCPRCSRGGFADRKRFTCRGQGKGYYTCPECWNALIVRTMA
jgi:hypothetical protein